MTNRKNGLLVLLSFVGIIIGLYMYNSSDTSILKSAFEEKNHNIVRIIVIGGIALTTVKYAGIGVLLLSPAGRKWACKQILKSKTAGKIIDYLSNLRRKEYP